MMTRSGWSAMAPIMPHAACPARGEIGIFNRSHYEEVLVVRVHQDLLAAQRLPAAATKGDVWDRRYREINDWERYLADQGIRVVKIYLNLSREEQRRRFLRRIDQPDALDGDGRQRHACTAASSGRAFTHDSSISASGSESQTIPPPTQR